MKQLRTNRGFTLIEVVVSLFIIAVGIAVASSVGASIKSSADAEKANIALRIAATELDTIRDGGYANVPANGTAFSSAYLSSLASSSASTTNSAYNAKTKLVSAGVSWVDSRGKSRYVSLTTLITQTGGL